MTNRNHWLDNAKFVLIFMVILGHSMDMLGKGEVCSVTNTTLSFFRMPMFIFLSGFFSKRTDWSRFGQWTSGLLETYLVFTLLQIGPGLLMGKTIPLSYFYIPRWALWYLLSLCFWRFGIQLLSGILSPIWLLMLSIVLGCLSGFVDLGPVLSLQRTFTLAPFFMIGYCCGREKVDLNIIKRLPAAVAILALILLGYGTSKIEDFHLLQFLRGMEPFSYFEGYSPVFLSCMRLCMYLVCMLVSICVLRLIPSKESWLSVQGRDTLFYYVYHPLIIYAIVGIGKHVTLPGSLPAVLIYAVLNTLIIWVLLKIPFFRILPRIFSKTITAVISFFK